MYGVVEEGRASWFLNIVIMTAPRPLGPASGRAGPSDKLPPSLSQNRNIGV